MRVQNLTPHSIKIKPKADTNLVFSIHPSGHAKVNMQYTASDNVPVSFGIADIPIESVKSIPGEVIGLPEPEDNTVYIVPANVAQAVPDRNDVYAPDTGSTAIRDDNGDILYITRLIQYGNPLQERVQELESMVEDAESHIELRDRIEQNRDKREEEKEYYRQLSAESDQREIERLEQEKWDLQDEIENKDHVWGTSRRSL